MNAAASDLWVSWDDYHRAIERLARSIYESGWEFDLVLCLARGGLRPGDVLSRIFEKPLGILAASSYREMEGTLRGNLEVANHITTTRGEVAGNILLVDDLVDSGQTLEYVARRLREDFSAVREVRSAVLWWKVKSAVVPDYFADRLEADPWIHQPFERYDHLRPQQLAEEDIRTERH
jgi:hypoxanthine phosphoribosyltransferase